MSNTIFPDNRKITTFVVGIPDPNDTTKIHHWARVDVMVPFENGHAILTPEAREKIEQMRAREVEFLKTSNPISHE